MDTVGNILETIEVTSEDRLGIRVVTMRISFLDYAGSDGGRAKKRYCERIVKHTTGLVPVCEAIEAELGIPVIGERVSITPIVLVVAASCESDPTP